MVYLEGDRVTDYSLKVLASKIEFNVEDYIPLMELFIDTTDSNLSDISTAVKISDKESISVNIHNIKGAAMNLGLESFTLLLEYMSKLNKVGSFADIEEVVVKCMVELNQLREILEKS